MMVFWALQICFVKDEILRKKALPKNLTTAHSQKRKPQRSDNG